MSRVLQDLGVYPASCEFLDGFGQSIQQQRADIANSTIVSGIGYGQTGRSGVR